MAPIFEVIVILLGPKTSAAVIIPGPSDLSHLRNFSLRFSKVKGFGFEEKNVLIENYGHVPVKVEKNF
jgi:hypothetical protein